MSELDKIIEKCIGDSFLPCQATCPLHVDVKGYIDLISQGKFEDALRLVREKLPFPGIIGRVCTHPCELKCERGKVDKPVSICALKRFIADYGLRIGRGKATPVERTKEDKVAIIGSGPAGLACAYDLIREGYTVIVFEAAPQSGGLLRYGIPEYRLPKRVLDNEISYLQELGVEIETNTPVTNLEEVFNQGYEAIFLATGGGISRKMGIPNDDAEGVIHALGFLKQVNSGVRVDLGERVAVVGGGNAVVDAARVAKRLGAKEVSIIYRRSQSEMPAVSTEVDEAEGEGIKLHILAAPIRVLTEDDRVTGIQCIRMELEEPDASGRRRPVPIKGSEYILEADTVVFAIGQALDPTLILDGGISLNKSHFIDVNPETLETSRPGVFAGGDAVGSAASVIDALAAGRKAATSIVRYLKGEDLVIGGEEEGPQESKLIVNIEGLTKKERVAMPTLPFKERTSFQEVELGFSEEEAKKEAERCLSCECKLCVKECLFLSTVCQTPKELAEMFSAGYFREKPRVPYSCNLCDLCERICPNGLNIGRMCLELRHQMVAEGLGPLKSHQYVKRDQEWSLSDSFTLSLPDLESSECRRVFFPGCNLSAYSPFLVIKTYDYLRERLPGTGIVLRCCGEPTHSLGEQARVREILDGLEVELGKLGASEIILACPLCYRTIKHHAPGLKLRFLAEVLLEIGLPDGISRKEWTFSLHDPCSTRWEGEMQECVRTLVERMGYRIEEMGHSRDMTRCCGMGGMILYVDPGLANSIIKSRVEEAPFDILTYCAACRDTLATVKPSLHILDLMFNPDWELQRLEPPRVGKARRENQALLKSKLINRQGVAE